MWTTSVWPARPGVHELVLEASRPSGTNHSHAVGARSLVCNREQRHDCCARYPLPSVNMPALRPTVAEMTDQTEAPCATEPRVCRRINDSASFEIQAGIIGRWALSQSRPTG